MKVYSRMIAKLLALGVLLTAFSLNAQAAGVRQQGDITGRVVATKFTTRHIVVADLATEKRYRVALAASITLLDGSKGALEDVLLDDSVIVKLDSITGDIVDLSVVAQY